MRSEGLRRFAFLIVLIISPAAAQSSPHRSSSHQGPSDSRLLTFEIVSIRPSNQGERGFSWATTPDGYHVTGQSLRSTILMAYFPQGWVYWDGRLSGGPPWLNDAYDIDAKVSEADLAAWQKQGLALDQKPMLQQMLQSMLVERCHLVFHWVPGEIDGFALELGKRSAHLVESKTDGPLPQGMRLPDGGVLVTSRGGDRKFYAASMRDFARSLSMVSIGHPIEDHTGLTGRYDFALNWIHDPDRPERDGFTDSSEPDPLSHWDLNALGFRLRRLSLPVDNLVIDHIDKPSEN